MQVFERARLDAQLQAAACAFVRDSVQVCASRGATTVALPRVCQWYARDFSSSGTPLECAQAVAAYVEGVRDELPTDRATVYEIPGGNHEQYGSYGSPGFAQGLAYESNPATISEEEQRSIVASALVATMRGV